MARLLRHFVAAPTPCAYLPDRDASLEYRLMVDIAPEELDHLLERGWRRFGIAYFRPRCEACDECVPLRVPVEGFVPSRQQRRALGKASAIRLEVSAPTIDGTRLALYTRWHAMQEDSRGWGPGEITEEEYFQQFAYPHPCVREFSFWDDAPAEGDAPRLVAISIVDETPNALSAVYTYHDPDYRKISLGTVSVLRQIERARATGRRWVYLGYRVLGCRSSEYKARFRPHETLVSWPGFRDEPRWRRVEEIPFDPSSRAGDSEEP